MSTSPELGYCRRPRIVPFGPQGPTLVWAVRQVPPLRIIISPYTKVRENRGSWPYGQRLKSDDELPIELDFREVGKKVSRTRMALESSYSKKNLRLMDVSICAPGGVVTLQDLLSPSATCLWRRVKEIQECAFRRLYREYTCFKKNQGH